MRSFNLLLCYSLIFVNVLVITFLPFTGFSLLNVFAIVILSVRIYLDDDIELNKKREGK